MARKVSGGTGMLIFFIVLGLVGGSLVTKFIGANIPFLTKSINLLNLPASNLNLGTIQIVFGANISLNLIGVIGILIGIIAYKLV
ncbi:MAG TPA: DUF4321 domain-containing protein [Clostridia bacterium]|jgi:hypothetical protein|nr:DUF4321 domain-containing protein [Clostridia bacterium]